MKEKGEIRKCTTPVLGLSVCAGKGESPGKIGRTLGRSLETQREFGLTRRRGDVTVGSVADGTC